MGDPIQTMNERESTGGTPRRIALVHSGGRGRTLVRYCVAVPREDKVPAANTKHRGQHGRTVRWTSLTSICLAAARSPSFYF